MAITKAAMVELLQTIHEELDKYYVKKDGDKVLSDNNFTDALKEKLDGIVEETITAEEVREIFNRKAGDGE